MTGDETIISEVHVPSQADFDLFARLSGDDNPIHVDPDFAGRTRFGRTVAHGMLLSSILWGMLHRHLKNAGRQLSQSFMFPNPAYADEPLRFSAKMQHARDGRITIEFTVARISDGAVTCEGQVAFAAGSSQL